MNTGFITISLIFSWFNFQVSHILKTNSNIIALHGIPTYENIKPVTAIFESLSRQGIWSRIRNDRHAGLIKGYTLSNTKSLFYSLKNNYLCIMIAGKLKYKKKSHLIKILQQSQSSYDILLTDKGGADWSTNMK